MLKSLVPLLGPDGGIPPFGRNPRSSGPYSLDRAAAGSAGLSSFNSGTAAERDWSRNNLAEEEEIEMKRIRAKTKNDFEALKRFAIEGIF